MKKIPYFSTIILKLFIEYFIYQVYLDGMDKFRETKTPRKKEPWYTNS